MAKQTPNTDLAISQGATFRKRYVWKTGKPRVPVNLTGATARLQVRSNVVATTVLLELTTSNGGISLGGTDGSIELFLSPSATTAIPWSLGVYDLFVYMPSGDTVHLIGGTVYIQKTSVR
jgi:hypothetical protein